MWASNDWRRSETFALQYEREHGQIHCEQRLKPQEMRTIWLKALGHSYREIASITGFSATKVNRCLAEGRKSFLERFEGIETGAECERWQPVLAAMGSSVVRVGEIRLRLVGCR